MIHAMTETEAVDTATLLGRTMLIRKLGEFQQAHLLRYVSIISSDNVDMMDRAHAVDRFLTIVHSSFKDDDDLKFVIRAEEEGKIGFEELIEALNGTNGPAKKAPAVKRAGRPRKSQ